MNRLLELNVIPIINENDTIATQEISVGDNDTMGAIVGSIAQPLFGIPQEMKEKALNYLPLDMKNVVTKFIDRYGE